MSERDAVRRIFGEALVLPVTGRAAYVETACVGDAALRGEVESLLAAHEMAQEFLGEPTVDSPRGGEGGRLNSADPAQVGMRIGRYKLLERIGEGGFGAVYMAEQEEPFQRRVALKIIKLGMDTKATLARFDAERQALAMMDHPNIARVFDAGSTETGRPFFVMELVKGVPITQYCDTNNLSPRQRLELFVPVCRAVQHAHQKGIIHRDLKPGNVLVTMHDGVPVCKVIDFGIAKAMNARLTEKTLFTEFRQFIGTPEYMSPEQAEMSGLDIDTRADIYALGVLLYELLTGTTPIDGKKLRQAAMGEIQRIIREVEPPKPSARLDTLGETLTTVAARRHTEPQKLGQLVRGELDWIVMKCLEKDRTRRYETVNGLWRDIERYMTDEPVEASPPSVAYRLKKFERRHRWAIRAVGTISLLLVAGVVVSTWQAVRATRATTVALTEKQRADEQAQIAESNSQRIQEQKWDLDRRLYFSDMLLAQGAWEANNLPRAQDLLARHLPQQGDVDLRGFEWYYWWRVGHSELLALRGHKGVITQVCYSPDDKQLASASEDGTVRLWNAITGHEIFAFAGHKGWIYSVCFSPDGRSLASGGYDKTVRIWDARTGQEGLVLTGHTGPVESVCFSPDGTQLASAGRDGTIRLWDSVTGKEIRTLMGHAGEIHSVCFSPDGKHLVSGSEDQTVKIWDATDGQERSSFRTGAYVSKVCFSPDGGRVAATTGLGARIWDAASGGAASGRLIRGLSGQLRGHTFNPSGTRLAIGDVDGIVSLWDAANGKNMAQLRAHLAEVHSLCFSPDGKRLASAGFDRTIKVWDADIQQEATTLKAHSGAVNGVCFSPVGIRMASCSEDHTVKIWDASSWENILTIKAHEADVLSVCFSPDGMRLASAGGIPRTSTRSGDPADGRITLWDARSGKEILTLQGHEGSVYGLCFSPDGGRLASAGMDGMTRIWDASTGTEIATLEEHYSVNSVCFSPDGKQLATGGRVVRIWDTDTRQVIFTFSGHIGAVISLCFSPDGRYLACGGSNGNIEIWDASPGQPAVPCKGHTSAVLSLKFSRDGSRLASAGQDKTIKLWDASTGQETLALKGHTGAVKSVSFSPDGQRLASASDDGAIKIWDATPAPENSAK